MDVPLFQGTKKGRAIPALPLVVLELFTYFCTSPFCSDLRAKRTARVNSWTNGRNHAVIRWLQSQSLQATVSYNFIQDKCQNIRNLQPAHSWFRLGGVQNTLSPLARATPVRNHHPYHTHLSLFEFPPTSVRR